MLGVNEKIIQDFVRNKYTKDYNIDATSLTDYLDKIVQVKVNVPVRKPEGLTKYVKELLERCKVFGEEEPPEGVETLIAEACRHNPRSIVRLINRTKVSVSVGKLEDKEYEPLILLLHLAMDEPKYKDFVSALDTSFEEEEGNKGTTIGKFIASKLKNKAKDLNFEVKIEGFAKVKWENAIGLLQRNPHLSELLGSPVGQRWLCDEDKCRTNAGEAVTMTQGNAASINRASDLRKTIEELQQSMILIPEGSFMMGDENMDDACPVHKVMLSAFHIQATPVTQAQYEAVMGRDPSYFKGPDRPVERVSWNDAVDFCNKLSALTGENYRLPSEAEWEYACRAGSTSAYCFGDDDKELGEYAWYDDNSAMQTHPVAQKRANRFGLYDMHGNVWEWCRDWYGDYSSGSQTDPEGPSTGSYRVLRGGSWFFNARNLRSANRNISSPGNSNNGSGFRLARPAVL